MEREMEKILYILDKRDAIRYFRVIARQIEDGAVLITQKGILGMTETEDITPMLPVNVGRSNETTPYQQAEIMARSKIGKLLDKGYKDLGPEKKVNTLSLEELTQFLYPLKGTDTSNRALPMLAQKPKYLKKRAVFPGYVQRKFNGIRGVANTEEETLRSRKGKLFTYLDHILDDLPSLPKGWEYDGELFSKEFSLNQIVSRVKREQEENKKIHYRVYDLIGTGLTYKERKKRLHRILKNSGPSVHRVRTYKVHKMEELLELFKRFLDEGYEGAMYRNPAFEYEQGTRSYGLIKVKDVLSEEFEIVGFEEATGRDAGTAIFVLKTKEGKIFKSRPMGTREERRQYWEERESLVGEWATILFQEYTEYKIPFHSRVETIRDYE